MKTPAYFFKCIATGVVGIILTIQCILVSPILVITLVQLAARLTKAFIRRTWGTTSVGGF